MVSAVRRPPPPPLPFSAAASLLPRFSIDRRGRSDVDYIRRIDIQISGSSIIRSSDRISIKCLQVYIYIYVFSIENFRGINIGVYRELYSYSAWQMRGGLAPVSTTVRHSSAFLLRANGGGRAARWFHRARFKSDQFFATHGYLDDEAPPSISLHPCNYPRKTRIWQSILGGRRAPWIFE